MNTTIIKTHKDIIAMFGGAHKLSGLLLGNYERDYHKIRKWNARNSIPAKYWQELLDIATREDLPLTAKLLTTTARKG